MNVLVVHNFYRQAGGEDEVFFAETRELERQGVNVTRHTVHNDDFPDGARVSAALRTVWNPASARTLARLVHERNIEVVHFHNTFPLVSPSAYYAVQSAGARVVQTLHNFKLLCPATTLYRDGHPCEDCVGKRVPWPAVQHACYRESRAASGVLAATLTVHRMLGTYNRMIDVYIALTENARDTYLRGGLPAEKLVVKPNFLPTDPGAGLHRGAFALFVGRLTPEKGILTLLDAWRTLGATVPLTIAGDGPLAQEVERRAGELPGVTYLGRQPRDHIQELMREARLLVFPSEWYEGFPMTLIEAFAAGLPVVASRLGSMASIIEHGVSGRHFQPGDAADLVRQVEWLLQHPQALDAMRLEVRRRYLEQYTARQNVEQLIGLYQRVLARQPEPALRQHVRV
ncbi:glycosyltransferase (plasmid) [Deinococcus sp. KNUC1210]|uniref:glycosyltransferase n=1 Tax=Deinococcus sp. KNUC1210 TaxID=2917691 RepID=UPI001EF00522|nr:glycosyltransferase [Deinococcus sp. KNUC1210]ULH17591.1 glycosyltransferase [Deinococcus sp. KNUC1210]